MAVLKGFFVVVVGLLMFATYIAVLVVFAKISSHLLPSFGILLFLAFAVGFALAFMKLQTAIERALIKRHVAQNPKSSWRYNTVK